jgi:2-keto-4-pentenoate hydratase/2-oxohepta-3-ene-1,7-dioic acid hydratase in catechol pathway
MRIARFVTSDAPRYGVVELAEDAGQHPDTIATLTGDPLAGPVNYTGERLHLDDVRLVAPVIPRSKVVAIGRNYAAHAAEHSAEVPAEPMCFLKPNTAVIGPGEPIFLPRQSERVEHEGELAVVIGRICKDVPADRVADVIFGYTVGNDVSARDLQARDGQWGRAKGFDTFCPLGPWIVTHLDLDEASRLDITVDVNGEPRQQGNTAQMVHGIADLVSFVSSFTTLLPGDVILTGTPAGVGPIVAGDTVSVTIEGIGTLTNPALAQEA